MSRVAIAAVFVMACSDKPPAKRDDGGAAAPPTEVVAWLAAHGARLDSTRPGHDPGDLAPIGRMVRDARVVAFGEATHGTREFTQLRHRFLEYLVAEKGFTVLALEASVSACRAINDYVVDGAGDPVEALRGIGHWTKYTEEMLAVIEWMRAWNVDPVHHAKIQLVGFDAAPSSTGGDVFHRFEARDLAMADQIQRELELQPAGTRTIIWAHNVHVGFGRDGARSMGRHLRERLGKDYVAFGFLFGRGAFRAVDQNDKGRGPVEQTVGAPPDGDVSAPFARTGAPLLAVDLREVRENEAVRAWFDAPHPHRATGAVFLETAMTSPIVLSTRFDAVIYVDAMTSSRAIEN
jgi:erythromycin esterase-like protein